MSLAVEHRRPSGARVLGLPRRRWRQRRTTSGCTGSTATSPTRPDVTAGRGCGTRGPRRCRIGRGSRGRPSLLASAFLESDFFASELRSLDAGLAAATAWPANEVSRETTSNAVIESLMGSLGAGTNNRRKAGRLPQDGPSRAHRRTGAEEQSPKKGLHEAGSFADDTASAKCGGQALPPAVAPTGHPWGSL
jgi:hypothetical protein